jgi:hypothetical protein
MSRPNEPALGELLARLGAPAGLCANCEHLRLLESARSVFARCGLASVDPRFRRYPPLPVRACTGYEPADAEPRSSETL